MDKPNKKKEKKPLLKQVPILSLILILIISIATISILATYSICDDPLTPPVYVGVSFCGNTTAEAKILIDKTKSYTNLFVMQSGPMGINETALTETCDYAVNSGLNLIVYFGWFSPHYPWQFPWVENATQKYGKKFLGIYYYDEPGGIQLDYDWTGHFINMSKRNTIFYQNNTQIIQAFINGSSTPNYDAEAKAYVDAMRRDRGITTLGNHSITKFTSDYALYWFDYLGGFDVIFTQSVANNSLTQEIALTRGAARMQNKTWGVIITWKYDQPPYLDNGKEIFTQMSMAYEAGAKYIILFNYPKIENNPYGVLTEDHFEALQHFWKDTMLTPKITSLPTTNQAEAVLVLPRNYGWGMRHIQDRIWLWGPDEKSPQIWNISRTLIAKYGLHLDIVYEDSAFPVQGKYTNIYYWNQTVLD